MLDSICSNNTLADMLLTTKVDMFADQAQNDAAERLNKFAAATILADGNIAVPPLSEQIQIIEDSILVIEGQISVLQTQDFVIEMLEEMYGHGFVAEAIATHRSNIATAREQATELRKRL